jgi:hypothetical protein
MNKKHPKRKREQNEKKRKLDNIQIKSQFPLPHLGSLVDMERECKESDIWDASGNFPESDFDEIVACSDIHGDLENVLFYCTNLCPLATIKPGGSMEWIAKRTAWVICGDIVDSQRGEVSRSQRSWEGLHQEQLILTFLDQLDLAARKHGGRVFKIMGNHEYMNMKGDFRYVSKLGMESFENRAQAFQPGGVMTRLLQACGLYAVLRIGRFIFVHGGIVDHVVSLVRQKDHKRDFVTVANDKLVQLLQKGVTIDLLSDPIQQNLFDQPDGLLWTRAYSKTDEPIDPESKVCHLANLMFQELGYTPHQSQDMMLIMGHSIQAFRCLLPNGKVNTQCTSSGYRLSKSIFEDDESVIYGEPLVKQHGIHSITFGCPVACDENKPQLCFLDVGASRAFGDLESLESSNIGRQPAMLDIKFLNKKQGPFPFGGFRRVKLFVAISKNRT